MTPVAAQFADLSDWWAFDDAGRNVSGRQLAAANRAIVLATRLARYDVDTSGAPADPEIVAAFREATLLQLDAILAVDAVTGSEAGQLAGVTEATIDGAAYKLAGPAAVRAQHIDPATGLAPDAWNTLLAAGLLDVVPTVWG